MNPIPVPIQTRALHVARGGRTVLSGIHLELSAGWTAIVGPNGAGKSTLLRALAGLDPVLSGSILIHGTPLSTLRPAQRARTLAWLAQAGHTSGELTVRETVALGRIAQRGLWATPDAHDARAVQQAMEQTGCADWAPWGLDTLSGGQRQRVLLARVLATQAPVLLLDEPTTHLDPHHQVALVRMLAGLARPTQPGVAPSRTVVTVLHDLPIALLADRVLVMQAGHLIADGPPTSTTLQRAIEAVFEHAVRITPGPHGLQVALAIQPAPLRLPAQSRPAAVPALEDPL